jgi:hypothetical protein
VFAVLTALLVACGGSPRNPKPIVPVSQPPAVAQEPATPQPTAPLSDPMTPMGSVAIVIGGQLYTEDYLARQWDGYLADCAAKGIEPMRMADHRERLIDELLLLRLAQRDPSTADPVLLARVEAQRRGLINQHYLTHAVFDDIEVTDEQVESHYLLHLDRYTVPEQARIKQMQFDTRQQADGALVRLSHRGEDFDRVAADLGGIAGDLGWIERGQLDSQISDAAFGLDVGEVSEVISTDIGFLIILRLGASPERVRPLSEVASVIRSELQAEQRRERLRRLLESERRREGFPGPPVLTP